MVKCAKRSAMNVMQANVRAHSTRKRIHLIVLLNRAYLCARMFTKFQVSNELFNERTDSARMLPVLFYSSEKLKFSIAHFAERFHIAHERAAKSALLLASFLFPVFVSWGFGVGDIKRLYEYIINTYFVYFFSLIYSVRNGMYIQIL